MVRLTTCDCGPAFLIRANRSGWMRLISSRRLYYCARCDTEMFVTRKHMVASAESGRPPLAALPPDVHETSVLG